MTGLPGFGRRATPARDHRCAFADQEPHRLEADPGGRAGDEATGAGEAEIHARLAYPAWRRRSCSCGTARPTGTARDVSRGTQTRCSTRPEGRRHGELADELAGDGVTAVYTSPLARARETAEILSGPLGRGTTLRATDGDRRRRLPGPPWPKSSAGSRSSCVAGVRRFSTGGRTARPTTTSRRASSRRYARSRDATTASRC